MKLVRNESADRVIVSDTLIFQPNTAQWVRAGQLPLIANAVQSGKLSIDGEPLEVKVENGETENRGNDSSESGADEGKPAPKRRRKPQPPTDDGGGVPSEATE